MLAQEASQTVVDYPNVDQLEEVEVLGVRQVDLNARNLERNKGNALSNGNVLYQREDYGRSYRFGMNYKFWRQRVALLSPFKN